MIVERMTRPWSKVRAAGNPCKLAASSSLWRTRVVPARHPSRARGVRLASPSAMRVIHQILAAVDFSDTSDRALDTALELAAAFDAELTVVHFFEFPIYGPEGTLLLTDDLEHALHEGAEGELERRLHARKTELPVRARICVETPWQGTYAGINALAEKIDADLVILGTHGRRGLKRALIGSVAEKVVRTSKRPVLTVHG